MAQPNDNAARPASEVRRSAFLIGETSLSIGTFRGGSLEGSCLPVPPACRRGVHPRPCLLGAAQRPSQSGAAASADGGEFGVNLWLDGGMMCPRGQEGPVDWIHRG